MDMIRSFTLLGFILLVFCYPCFQTNPVFASEDSIGFNCSSFPEDFVFGSSSAAYQYEGAAIEGGRGPSVWDTFVHKYPGKIVDGSNGDVTEDFYHRYKEDVQLMKFIGFGGFRLSISWSRVLPSGKLSGGVNKEGVAFYNNLIDELLANDVQPFVTIFHWDTPQALQDEYGGFLSSRIVDDFRDFAEVCFKEFGDRVKYWFTMNEPYIYITGGYDLGIMAPGRCSAWMSNNCSSGDSATEPYLVGHHMLLAHAAATKVYKAKYQASQKGQIGITTVSHWFEPLTNSTADKKAAKRALDFMYGWFIHPLTYGDYPKTMRLLVGKRLPRFTEEEAKLVKGSLDFIGLNYFTSLYASDASSVNSTRLSSYSDPRATQLSEQNGIPIGRPTAYWSFFDTPKGFKDLLIYTKTEYKNLSIYITENGMADSGDQTVDQGVKDTFRIEFFRGHFLALQEAIKAGVDVKGHFAWSLLDTFEWSSGYTVRFGLTYVDYKDGLKRYIKSSGMWYKKLLSHCKKTVSGSYSL